VSKKVKVTRTIVYDYDEIVQSIRDVRGKPEADISEDEVMDLIDAWVYEDFQSPVTLNLLNMEFVDVATEFIKHDPESCESCETLVRHGFPDNEQVY
jgi:hypothetical protein